MPKSKTIEIDEVITAEQPADDGLSSRGKTSSGSSTPPFSSDNPFADLEKSLPWKARWTLKLTRWFMFLRSKAWGKVVIVPAVILGVLLAIPMGVLLIVFLVIRSLFKSISR
ncbi:MAG: hypothetical protein AB8F34_02185 [Akkermansiaceae bacterium]